MKGLPGELAGVGEAPGEGGVMHHRAVYGLAGSPGAPMLDVRDVFKVCLLPFSFSARLPCSRFLQEPLHSAQG